MRRGTPDLMGYVKWLRLTERSETAVAIESPTKWPVCRIPVKMHIAEPTSPAVQPRAALCSGRCPSGSSMRKWVFGREN